MRKISLAASAVVVFALVAGCSSAGPGESSGTTQQDLGRGQPSELNDPLPGHFPTQERFARELAHGGGGGGGHTSGSNLSYHGGPTITSAHIVAIFWGSSWSTSDPISTSLSKYIANYGGNGEYHVITQYSGIQSTNLAGGRTTVWYDSSNPPTNVTDADTQAEVQKCINATGYDASAIYEVFTPNGVYSSDGSSDSCGGSNLQYCAYHGHFTSSGGDTKYASMPYPSCAGCQSTGFTDAQNFEHFISHETREAVTDEDGNAWYDKRGYEADDKCAWSPAPFTDSANGTNADGSAFAYQYEWSNANSGCIQKN